MFSKPPPPAAPPPLAAAAAALSAASAASGMKTIGTSTPALEKAVTAPFARSAASSACRAGGAAAAASSRPPARFSCGYETALLKAYVSRTLEAA